MPVYDKILNHINQPENAAILKSIASIISPHSEEIAKDFYREMLINVKAAEFLNHEEVKKRLTSSMASWINFAFVYRENAQAIHEYKSYQLHIGHIHGKIGLPVSLVNYGMYIIKQDVLRLLIGSELSRQKLGEALIITNQILDCALQIINESYEGDLVNNEKDSQAFKIQFSTHHLAFDCERLRTALSDWMRDLLLNIHQDSFDMNSLLTIKQTNFGLWVTHKAALFLSNRAEYATLTDLLDQMDETFRDLVGHSITGGTRQKYLKKLNALVSQSSWVLGNIAKEIIDQDNGRDPLTRLFNRRYLDTVMRYETASSLKTGVLFGVLILDVDFFKKINDTYGHENGDRVLMQLAELLTQEVRAGDFVFRLGGEEFLIVLGNMNWLILTSIAEKVRLSVSNTVIKLDNEQSLAITVSIGIALHDGHPDFQRTIKLADDALYQAKQNGRNQVVSANQSNSNTVESK